MIIPHEKFCVLPWVSLEASPVGTVRPCCLFRQEVVNNDGEKYVLGSATLEDIRNSNYMQQIRQQFIDAQQPTECNRCWSEEAAGRTSKRMHSLIRLNEILQNESIWSNNAKDLSFVDLKLGNICNLKCRICGSWSSSSYATEELKFTNVQHKKDSFHYSMLSKGAWPRHNPQFWQGLYTNAKQIRYLEFTGGEPFMIREHFDFLQYLIDQGLSKNIEIHYNTNGTIVPDNAELWNNFKHVEIAFSVDDVSKRYEYQRSGAKWTDVNNNIDRFITLANQSHGTISLQICCTINVFNVLYLEEIAQWLEPKLKEFDFVYWNMLHDAPEFCISNLPMSAKQVIAQRLSSAVINNKFKQEFANVITFMMQGQQNLRTELIRHIRQTDYRRGELLTHNHLELAYLIGYE